MVETDIQARKAGLVDAALDFVSRGEVVDGRFSNMGIEGNGVISYVGKERSDTSGLTVFAFKQQTVREAKNGHDAKNVFESSDLFVLWRNQRVLTASTHRQDDGRGPIPVEPEGTLEVMHYEQGDWEHHLRYLSRSPEQPKESV